MHFAAFPNEVSIQFMNIFFTLQSPFVLAFGTWRMLILDPVCHLHAQGHSEKVLYKTLLSPRLITGPKRDLEAPGWRNLSSR